MSIREPISRRVTSTAERGRTTSIATMSSRSRTARCTDSDVRSASSIMNGRERARMSKLRRKPWLSSSTDAVSTKRSLSGNWNRKPALTSVAVMRETVGFGMPVSSVSSRLLTGASAAAMRRSTARPRARAVISSGDDSRSRDAGGVTVVDTRDSL